LGANGWSWNVGYTSTSDTWNAWVNYYGYAGGQTKFRNFVVGDGKGIAVATFTGATKLTTLAGALAGTRGVFSAASGSSYALHLKNTTAASPYTCWIEEPASPTAGYPLLSVTSSGGTNNYFRIDSGTGSSFFGGALAIASSGAADLLTIKDTLNTGNSATPYIRFKDSGDNNLGYFGYGSGSNGDFYWDNSGGGDFRINGGDVILAGALTGTTGTFSSTLQATGGVSVVGTLGTWSIDNQGAVLNFSRGANNYIRANNAAGALRFDTGGNNSALFLASDQSATFSGALTGTSATFSGATGITIENTSTTNVQLKLRSNGVDTWRIGQNLVVTGSTALEFYDDVNNVDRMVITNSGKVGIGTTAPYGGLHVNASNYGESPTINKALLVSDSADVTKYLILTYHASVDVGIIQGLDDSLAWKNVAINPNGGNVGIGTTAPATKLHAILDSSATNTPTDVLRLGHTSSGSTAVGFGALIRFDAERTGTTTDGMGRLGFVADTMTSSRVDGAFIVQTGLDGSYTERFRIKSDGNVGIGTNAPLAKLHVKLDSASSGYSNLRIQSATYPSIEFYSDNAATNNRNWKISSVYNSYGTFEILSSTAAGGVPTTTRLAINKDGNVGIGTTAPDQKLSVTGNIQARSGYWFIARSADNAGYSYLKNPSTSGSEIAFHTSGEKMRLLSNGNFGIGTAAPLCKLDIRTTSASLIDAGATVNIEEDAAWTQGLALYINNADTYNGDYASACIGVANSGSNIIITAGAKVVNNPASSNGYKTLNSTAPSVYRQLNGAHLFYGDTGKTANTLYTPTERMRIAVDGKVGIGITAPTTTLDVYHATHSQLTVSSPGNQDSSLSLIERTSVSPFGSANVYGFQWKYDGGDNKLYLSSGVDTNVVNRLTVQRDDGNVGIGTTVPTAKLHVAGDGLFDSLRTTYHFSKSFAASFANGTANLVGYISFGNSNPWGWIEVTLTGSYSNTNITGRYTKRFAIGRNVSAGISSQSSEVIANIGDIAGKFKIGAFEVSGTTLRLPIYSLTSLGNNVQIFVEGHVHAGSAAALIVSSLSCTTPVAVSNTETRDYFTMMADRVGIGTNAPAATLDVHGSMVRISSDGGAYRRLMFFDSLATPNKNNFQVAVQEINNALHIGPSTAVGGTTFSGSTGLAMLANGNVGIGTASPTSGFKLDVNGYTRTSLLTLRTSAAGVGGTVADENSYELGPGYLNLSRDDTAAARQIQFGKNGSLHSGIMTDTNGLNFVGSDGAADVTIKTNGYVGIGTTAPAYPLDVQSGGVGTVLRAGTAFVSIDSTGSAAAPSLIFNGDSDMGLWRPAANTLAIATAGVERLRILADGTLDLKSAKFKINGSAGSNGETLTTDGSGNISWSAAGSGTISGSGTDNYVPRFNGAGALQNSALFSSDSGNVGIGTAAPDTLLDLQATGGADMLLLRTTGDTSGVLGAISFGNANLDKYMAQIRVTQDGATDSAQLQLQTQATGAGKLTRMTIKGDGKVGFGTTSPAADVHFYQGPDNRVMIESNGPTLVFKEINSTNQNWAFYHNAGALNIRTLADNFGSTVDRVTFLQDGKVGIGTAAPTAKLFVMGDSTARAFQAVSSSAGNATGYFYTNMVHTGVDTSATVSIRSDHVSSSGQILHVRGDGSGNLLTLDQGGTNRLVVQADGDVGIGTTTPSAKIHVAGTGDVARIGDNHWRGTNSVTVGTTYATGVTVNLANHKSGYLKVIISGDWSGHSAIGYMSEYFIQKGSTVRYSQPGTVIREVTNQHNSDYITSQILDPTLNDGNADFAIQFKTNTGSVSCTVMYEFTGTANSVT